uniref:Uncharacterized protein n=1 Tax=Cucumis melo TaxID=3656 RepID=A0A9I9DVA5_CUCME
MFIENPLLRNQRWRRRRVFESKMRKLSLKQNQGWRRRRESNVRSGNRAFNETKAENEKGIRGKDGNQAFNKTNNQQQRSVSNLRFKEGIRKMQTDN